MSKSNLNNFLHPKKSKKIKKIKKRLIILTSVIGGVLLIIVILFFIYKGPAKRIYNYGLEGKNLFFTAQENLINQDFETAQNNLTNATENFNKAHQQFGMFKWLKLIPVIGTQISAIDNLLIAGVSTGESLKKITNEAQKIITPIQKNGDVSLNSLTEEETELLLKNIYESKPILDQAKQSIDVAVDKINKIPNRGLLKRIKNITDPLKEKLPELQSAIDQAISSSQIIPTIAGYPEQKTYLFLLQNNTEIRPTGGFIGTYGILKLKNGDITNFNTENSYNLDEPAEAWLNEEPPWPLTRYNNVTNWFFRDSNWSPDFPTTAAKAEWFYNKERGPEKNIDGIIAVTPTFIKSLLALTGDIKVNGLIFNADNLIEVLQYQVDQGYLSQNINESERKEIIGVLSKKILDKILDLPKSKWSDLWLVINKDIKEKHILVNLKNNVIQDLLVKENWAGKITNVDHDYFTVIDANLASLKSDPGVKRTIEYVLNYDSGNLIADLTINYKNEGTLTWKTTRYRTYTRVYVPAGSNLLKSTGSMVDCKLPDEGSIEQLEELNKISYGTFICIEPGEEKSLSFKYKLPERIVEQLKSDSYKLLIQKQAGAENYDLLLRIKSNDKIKSLIGVDSYVKNDKDYIEIDTQLSKDILVDILY